MKNNVLKPIFLALLAVFCGGCKSSKENPLLTRLKASVAEGKILYGHQDDLCYGHNWRATEPGDSLLRSDVFDVTGHYPAVLGLELGELELGGPLNLDGEPFEVIRRAAVVHNERGGIVTISWHPRNPLTGGTAWDVSSDKVVASILPGGEKEELFKGWLNALGDFLSGIRTPDGEAIPFIFRPWHEHTGSWFWWGRDLCTTEEFAALFRLTHDYLTLERGLTNIVWSYSPNSGVDAEGYMERWPGDEYVDLMGFDAYAFEGPDGPKAGSERLAETLTEAFKWLPRLGELHGKPIALTETGFQSIPDPTWWTETIYPAIKDVPIAYLLTWRNAPDDPAHFYAPWKGFENAGDFVEFCNLDKITLL